MSIRGRAFPPNRPRVAAPVVGLPAAFNSHVTLAGKKGGAPRTQRPLLGPYLLSKSVGVSTPDYIGYFTMAGRKGIQPRTRNRIIYASPVVGPAAASLTLQFTGLFTYVVRGQIPRTKLQLPHLTRFTFTPVSGFVGPKSAFLTVKPTRSVSSMKVQPTRTASLTVN